VYHHRHGQLDAGAPPIFKPGAIPSSQSYELHRAEKLHTHIFQVVGAAEELVQG
jgi:hypothetical protein